MNHWIIAPIVLPAILAPFIILTMRHHLTLQRIFSIAGTAALTAIAIGLLVRASGGGIEVYELGAWPAPFGIVLVLDRLSALMVTLTSLLALCVVLYAAGSGWDGRGKHFHALFQFQLMGVLGAFLTGDAFNLFVFFEVLLIASYGLMIHGGGATRLRAGIQYMVYNLLGSTLFLFALGTLYSVTGTLNMADLAVRAAAIPIEESALLRVGSVLLLLVFAVKAAVLPLHFWLPSSYANAPAPVAALFAIMTKVGAYAILRMHTLVFGPELEAVRGLFDVWLLPAALLTLAIGMAGILGSRDVARMTAFAAIGSMGTLMIAVSLFTPEATTAALYYMIHSTFATAAMFLVADLVTERRGAVGGAIVPGPPIAGGGLISALYFAAAIALAGMPPLSGFIGKLMVLDASRDDPLAALVWTVVLATSLIAIIGFARAGSTIFWSPPPEPVAAAAPAEADVFAAQAHAAHGRAAAATPALAIAAVFAVLAPLVLATVFAGQAAAYVAATADQLYAPDGYISAVLGAR